MSRSIIFTPMLIWIQLASSAIRVSAFAKFNAAKYFSSSNQSIRIGDKSKHQHASLVQSLKDENIGCEHFGKCPGCSFDANVDKIPMANSAKLYFSSSALQKYRSNNIAEEYFKVIVPSSLTHWRTQAKLAVAPRSSWGRDGCIFGLYEKGTHRVMAIPNCKVHHPSINTAVQILSKASANAGTVAYNEDTGEGDLRYVQLQVERLTQRVTLTLVWNAPTIKDCQPRLARLTKELKRLEPNLWHSIWCNCNNNVGNVIFARGDDRWHRLHGFEFIREPIPGTGTDEGKLYFNPKAFRQGNMDGFDTIAQYVAQNVPAGSKVCELYAGIGILGLTSLSLHGNVNQNADNAKRNPPLSWLRCSDENPENDKLFHLTLRSMSKDIVEFQSKQLASYMTGTATKVLLEGQALGADIMIVDPPRKGLCDEVLNQLCKAHNPKQPSAEDPFLLSLPRHLVNWTNDIHTLIYVSCGFDSLARDCDRLLSANAGWRLDSSMGYVLFPGSDHLESVVVLKRQNASTNR